MAALTNPATPKSAAPTTAPQAAVEPQAQPAQTTPEIDEPTVERVTIGGLVVEKTSYSDGEYEMKTLREPTIEKTLIRATRAHQQSQGY